MLDSASHVQPVLKNARSYVADSNRPATQTKLSGFP